MPQQPLTYASTTLFLPCNKRVKQGIGTMFPMHGNPLSVRGIDYVDNALELVESTPK